MVNPGPEIVKRLSQNAKKIKEYMNDLRLADEKQTPVAWAMSESIKIRADLSLDLGKCTGCGACTSVCPTGAIQILFSQTLASITYAHSLCLYCRRCGFACPEKAIQYGGVLEPFGVSSLVMHIEEKMEVELQRCKECGSGFTTKPLVTKAKALLGDEAIEVSSLMTLCPSCRSRELVLRAYRLWR